MIEVEVCERNDEAEGICSFHLRRVDGAPLPHFEAGAHVDVHLPCDLVRQYSLYSPYDAQDGYRISVLNDPASRGGSASLHSDVQVGMRLHISAPRNLFALADGARHSLLFAGGIGITPILCMAEQLAAQGKPFTLHYCARSASRAAFVERLARSAFAQHVVLHFDDQPETALDAAATLAAAHADDHLYVCGPGGFMQHILDSARVQGWAQERVHREYFAAPAVETQPAAGSFAVKLNSSGQVYEVPADLSVAKALESHGVFINVSCEQGICGTCLTGVLEGVPEHRDLYLSEEEQARNDQFTPCCSRARTPLLVLDL